MGIVVTIRAEQFEVGWVECDAPVRLVLFSQCYLVMYFLACPDFAVALAAFTQSICPGDDVSPDLFPFS